METIGWGVLATGKIATAFARDLGRVPGAALAAVGSRRPESAERFAAEHGAARAHASYQALVRDPDVDVVYIASPHALHLAHARLALEAGKPVLCEKPLTLNVSEAEELFALAAEHGLFCMEAMWMACHPLVRAVLAGFAAGRFGEPQQVHADLGFVVDRPPGDRLVEPALGAGALLDMGIYPLTLAHLVLGAPEQLTASAGLSGSGVDLNIAIAGRYAGGAVAALTASMTAWSPRTASIATSTGRVDLAADFHSPRSATFTPGAGGEPQPIEPLGPILGSGLGNEAAEVGRCLREGVLESPLVPHAQTLAVLGQMDEVRRQVGVRYRTDRAPGEAAGFASDG